MQLGHDEQSVNASDPVSWRNIPTDWKKRSPADIEALARALRYSAAKDPPPKAKSVYRKIERMEAHCATLKKQENQIAAAESRPRPEIIVSAGAIIDEAGLVHTIKVHIAKGDQAREKATQHYIAAGQHLKTLKAAHTGSWAEWEKILKDKIGIGKSRASELMLIADGTKTVEEVAAATTERSKKHRALSPLRNGETAAAAKKAAVASAVPAKTVPDPIAPDEELALLREFARLFISERARITCDPKDHDECWMVFNRVKAMLGGAL